MPWDSLPPSPSNGTPSPQSVHTHLPLPSLARYRPSFPPTAHSATAMEAGHSPAAAFASSARMRIQRRRPTSSPASMAACSQRRRVTPVQN